MLNNNGDVEGQNESLTKAETRKMNRNINIESTKLALLEKVMDQLELNRQQQNRLDLYRFFLRRFLLRRLLGKSISNLFFFIYIKDIVLLSSCSIPIGFPRRPLANRNKMTSYQKL
ncbi:MAG TPA: hypothetical protein VFL47_09365 [Flavisolibacter sp.]|nr:hypothetical protein [Flavisolibacter sp.]